MLKCRKKRQPAFRNKFQILFCGETSTKLGIEEAPGLLDCLNRHTYNNFSAHNKTVPFFHEFVLHIIHAAWTPPRIVGDREVVRKYAINSLSINNTLPHRILLCSLDLRSRSLLRRGVKPFASCRKTSRTWHLVYPLLFTF